MSVLAAAAVPDLAEARRPAEALGFGREEVRLLVASPERFRHARFRQLPELLSPGDLVVVNTSRTLPASIPARRDDGRELTVNLSTPVPFENRGRWVVELRRDGRRVRDGRSGERLALPDGEVELLAPYMGTRLWVAALELPGPLLGYLEHHGRPIRYGHLEGEWPLQTLQNVYATEPGSAEMPSAGRPFTDELVTELVSRGVLVAPVTLHCGVSSLEAGESPYPERYRVPPETARLVNAVREWGGRVIAVGTTVVRALETVAAPDGAVEAGSGITSLMVTPERGLHAIDGLVTGWHEPESSHLSLLEAAAGPELLRRSYAAAHAGGYRFHEFGDSHLILP